MNEKRLKQVRVCAEALRPLLDLRETLRAQVTVLDKLADDETGTGLRTTPQARALNEAERQARHALSCLNRLAEELVKVGSQP